MSSEKFELLKELLLAHKMSPQDTVIELRQLLKKVLDDNNHLIDQKWQIDIELAKDHGEDSQQLLERQIKIENEIKQKDYNSKITQIKDEIYRLEMELYGHSDIGSKSPYKL